MSARCRVRRLAGSHCITFESLAGFATGWRGRASLLFHLHDEHLEGLRQMVVKGAMEDGPAGPASASGPAPCVPEFVVTAVVTANGRSDTDRMPHVGAPLHMLQFLRVFRRQARTYSRKRGTPWPAIPHDDIGRAVRGQSAGP